MYGAAHELVLRRDRLIVFSGLLVVTAMAVGYIVWLALEYEHAR